MPREMPISFEGRQSRPFLSGTRKYAFLLDESTVVKIAHIDKTETAAQVHLRILQKEYGAIERWVSPFMAKSNFLVEEGNKGSYLVAEWQPLYHGPNMKAALSTLPELNQKQDISDFLSQCANMYRETGRLPDIFGRIKNVGFYNVLNTPNVIVDFDPIQDQYHPVLVDTQFSRLNKTLLVGKLNTFLLFLGINYALKSIKNG